jgi:hypothetical protein
MHVTEFRSTPFDMEEPFLYLLLLRRGNCFPSHHHKQIIDPVHVTSRSLPVFSSLPSAWPQSNPSFVTMGFGTKIADKFLLDENFTRARRGIVQGAKGFGPGAVQYLVNKVPIFQWLPNYSPRWLIADVIAGQSVGMSPMFGHNFLLRLSYMPKLSAHVLDI